MQLYFGVLSDARTLRFALNDVSSEAMTCWTCGRFSSALRSLKMGAGANRLAIAAPTALRARRGDC